MEQIDKDFIKLEAILVGILIGLLLLLFASCTTTEYVTVEKVRTDTTYITKHQRDSIYIHDSTAVERKDSIIKIEHWHTKFVDRAVHDTLYKSKTDSVPVPYPIIKEVKQPLSKPQKGLMLIGLLTVMAVTVWICWKLKRFLPLR